MEIIKKLIICLGIIIISTVNNINAQILLKGTVLNAQDNSPLTGVSIYVQKLKKGTTTDSKGKFLFKLPEGKHKIKFSFLGYKTIEKTLSLEKNTNSITIYMEETTVELNEVKVTAKSEAREIREQAMPISVITMHELQGTVSDVSEVLSKTAGVKIRASGGVGSSSRISVRGLEGKRVGFFIDETPLNDNTDFLDINDIPVDLIDRVEVYKGIVPAKFGGSSMGGAVNIVLKEYPPTYVDAAYSRQSFNTHKFSTVFKSNKNGYEAGIGGFYTYSDNNYKMELPLQPGKFIIRDHDRFEKITIGGGFKSKNWWFNEVVFEPAVIFTKKEIQGIEYNIQEAESEANAYVLSNHIEKENFLIEGLDFDFNNTIAYTVFKFQDKAMQRYTWDGKKRPPATIYGGEIGTQPSDVNNKKYNYSQKINLNYILNKRNSITLNSQYNYAKGIPSNKLRDKVIGYKTNFNSDMNSWVVGLTHEYNSLNQKLTNAFTVKYYLYSMKTLLSDFYGISSIPEKIDMKKQDFGISNAIRYRFTPEFLIKTSLGYDVRLPSESELLGDGFIIVPAGNLEPERNTSFNLGFMYDLSYNRNNRIQLEINGFYMQLENMIRFTGGSLQNKYENFGEMRTIGGEFEVKWDASDWLYLWSNLTYQDLRDTREFEAGSSVPNPTKNDRIPNIPYFFTNAGLELHKENLFGGIGQNTRFFTDCSFVEEYFYDFEQSIYQERRIPTSLVINAGLEHSLYNQSIFISLQMNNITNEKVLSEFNRPLPGRNFGFKVRYVMK
ncbi:MAG: TonB-dependent receptor [Ignavibacteriae bacterium]|nr:MAG: TonB-dependent receptor [Ignavibacteriota bacterium]